MIRKLDPDQLTPTEQRIARIVARQPQIANKPLGAAVGITEERACTLKRSAKVQAAIARLSLDTSESRRDSAREDMHIGRETLRHLAQRSANEHIRLRAACRLIEYGLRVEPVAATTAPLLVDEVTIRRRVSLALGLGGPLVERIETEPRIEAEPVENGLAVS